MSEIKDTPHPDDLPIGIQRIATPHESLAEQAIVYLQHLYGVKSLLLTEHNEEDFTVEYVVLTCCEHSQIIKAFMAAMMDCSWNDYDLAQAGLTDQESFGMEQYPFRVVEKFPPDEMEEANQ